ncbi:ENDOGLUCANASE [Salix koriyanagi]|uniref:ENDOGLUCANASE n=1 Tax=Salix koriyanagi TaxID=2511006 RepID=A0A9Q0QMS9_9ROSI|nr:ENDOGLUCANASE [Salix koriyanagi]
MSEQGVFCWNNKLTASAVLLTSLRYFHELGYPYDVVSGSSSNKIDLLIVLIFPMKVGRSSRPHHGEPFQLAATASFLGRLYSNDLKLLRRSGVSRSSEFYSGNVAKIVHVPGKHL